MIVATNNGATQFQPIEAGSYVARCYSMIHIGTCLEEIMGEKKLLNKVRITWELPTELKIFKEESGEQPCVISKEFTLSMHEKSTLRKWLESWRGLAFTDEESRSFDISKLLGVPCALSIIHKIAKNGNKYAEIANVSTLMKGINCPPQVNKSFEFSVLDYDQQKFDSLPDFIKEKIKTSVEYKQLVSPHPPIEAHENEEENESLPF